MNQSQFEQIAKEYIKDEFRMFLDEFEEDIENLTNYNDLNETIEQYEERDYIWARENFDEWTRYENNPCLEPCACTGESEHYLFKKCYELYGLKIKAFLLSEESDYLWKQENEVYKSELIKIANEANIEHYDGYDPMYDPNGNDFEEWLMEGCPPDGTIGVFIEEGKENAD